MLTRSLQSIARLSLFGEGNCIHGIVASCRGAAGLIGRA